MTEQTKLRLDKKLLYIFAIFAVFSLFSPVYAQTGTINLDATLGGSPVPTSFVASGTGPNGPIPSQTYLVPTSTPNLPSGTYSANYQSGGPAGSVFQSITPSSTQTLESGSSITFTFNFACQSPFVQSGSECVGTVAGTPSCSVSPSTISVAPGQTTTATVNYAYDQDGIIPYNCGALSGSLTGTPAPSGTSSMPVQLTFSSAGTYNCVLTVQNRDGTTRTCSATVNVAVAGTTPPTVNIKANNQDSLTVTSGSTVTLSWTSSGASGCTASGSWSGSKATSGSETVNPTATSTYTISCTGSGGSITDSVTVTVTAPGSCNNGVINTGEVCDGTNLGGQTCTSSGFTGGTLRCNSNCLSYDTSSCTGTSTPSQNNMVFDTSGTFSWTAPSGVTSVTVELWGGGGSGGPWGGGGGGGAGYGKGTYTVTPGTSYTITVGKGGTSSDGFYHGTNSSFGNLIFASGGRTGESGYEVYNRLANGGAGGISNGNIQSIAGEAGAQGSGSGTIGIDGGVIPGGNYGGRGGNAPLGGFGGTAPYGAGGSPGAGGGGNIISSYAGGNGGTGKVIVIWTVSTTTFGLPSCTYSFSPASISQGQTSTITWSSSGDSDGQIQYSCTGNLASGTLPTASGSTSATPTSTQTCTLTVQNSAGTNTCTGSVTVGSTAGTTDFCGTVTERIGVETKTVTATDEIVTFNTTTRCTASCSSALIGSKCIDGTGGSRLCTEYSGGPTMKATVSWTATGGNGNVNYVGFKNSRGTAVKWSTNICFSGAASFSADLPVADSYTYEIYTANCVRTDACSGCGSDRLIMQGGPFGCPNCVGNGCACTSTDILPVSQCTYQVKLNQFATDDTGGIILRNPLNTETIAEDATSCPYVCTDSSNPGKTASCKTAQTLNSDITGFIVHNDSNFIDLIARDHGDYSRGVSAIFELRNRKINAETQYCVAGTAFAFCSNNDNSCGTRTCENCNLRDGWYNTTNSVVQCSSNALTTLIEQEQRDYGCSSAACQFVVRDRRLVNVSVSGSCNVTASVRVSPNVVKTGTEITISSTAVAQKNVSLECTANSAVLCNSGFRRSNPSCSFNSTWTDNGVKSFSCTIREDVTVNSIIGVFPLSVTSDNTAPAVVVEGAPAQAQESAIASASCTDNVGCRSESIKLFLSETNECPQNYSQYDTSPPRNISRRYFVCAAALDMANNEGFSEPVEFNVAGTNLPLTQIISPANGSLQGSNFSVSINDTGNLLTCDYRIISNGEVKRNWSFRDCNRNVVIPVPSLCSTGSCIIEARAIDVLARDGFAGRAEYTIDLAQPTVSILSPQAGVWQVSNFTVTIGDSFKYSIDRCDYRIVSGGTETVMLKNRSCNGAVTISVGQSMDCRNDGANTCKIEARAVGSTGPIGVAERSFSIDLSGNNYDFNGFGNVNYAQTDTGVNFSGSILSTITFPTFIACNGNTRIAECKDSYSVGSQNCGLGKPCLCGSLSSLACDLKCNDLNSTFYLVVKGFSAFEEKVVVSNGKDFACPSFRLGEINNITEDFKELARRGEVIRQQLIYLIERSEGDKKFEYDNLRQRVVIGLSVIRDYLNYVNDSMRSLSVSKANEIIARGREIKGRVLELIFTPVVSAVSINSTQMPDETIVGSNSSFVVNVDNRGRDIYARVECEFSGGSTTIRSSSCQFISANRTKGFSIPIDTQTIRAANVTCLVLSSTNNQCTSPVISDLRSLGILKIRNSVLSFVTINKPADIVAGEEAILQADVKNTDTKEQSAYINCTFSNPRVDIFYGTSEPQSLLAQETRTFFATVETRTAGTWTVRSCTVYNAAAVPFAESSRVVNEAFVVSQAPVAECSVNPDCPGTDIRCFCSGSGSCQACSLGTKCISRQCVAIECTINAQCASGQICSDENKCVVSSVGFEPVGSPPSLTPQPFPWTTVLFFSVIIAVPAGLYIYFRARVRVEP